MKLHSFLPMLSATFAMTVNSSAEWVPPGSTGCQPTAPTPDHSAALLRAVIGLTDGSRIVGTPLEKLIPIDLFWGKTSLPLEVVTRCEIEHGPESITLYLQNGDRLTGKPGVDSFPLETMLGKLNPSLSQIDRIEMSVRSTGLLTEGKGDITFGGVKWEAWRTGFEVQVNRLASLPRARAGFNYGHGGNGRGAQVATNIGEKDWTDYRIDVDYCMTGVDPAFNPHGLPVGWRSGGILFHVAAATESWNAAPGIAAYHLNLNAGGAEGEWSLTCIHESYCKTDVGFGNPTSAGARTLASGKGLNLDATKGNHFRIDVIGKRIAVWVDDNQILDLRDEKMDEEVAGKSLDHGGVAFGWGWECMGWIENFKATRL